MKIYRTLPSFAVIAWLWASPAIAGHISGTAKGDLISQFNGACNIGYSSFCPSGVCECDEFSGTISGTPIGKGSVVVAATIDLGAATSSGNTCVPVFLVLQLATPKASQTINAVGAACNSEGGFALTGGFGVAFGGSGSGTATGTLSARGLATIKYSGTD